MTQWEHSSPMRITIMLASKTKANLILLATFALYWISYGRENRG